MAQEQQAAGELRPENNFLSGSGELAAMMRAKDWSATAVGVPETWPHSLRTVVRILLTSRYAMWMGWGQDLTFFCNDAYLPTVGIKRSWVLGSSARKVWEEIWPDIGPRIDVVLQRGEATWDQGLLLFLERSGYPEETYHTFSYSPLTDDSGAIAGMLCVVTEETERVIGERRLALLNSLGGALASINTQQELFAAIERGGDAMQIRHALHLDGLRPLRGTYGCGGRNWRRPILRQHWRGQNCGQTTKCDGFHGDEEIRAATSAAARGRPMRAAAALMAARRAGSAIRFASLNTSVAPSTALMAAPDSSR